MPVHTFSTKTKQPQDEAEVQKLKDYCIEHNLNFSGIMIKLIKECNDGQAAKV